MKFKIALAALLFASAGAQAADLATKAPPINTYMQPFSWTGFYVGAHIGDEFGAFDPNFNSNNAGLNAAVASLTDPGVLGPNSNGVFGGVQLGFKYQTGAFVWDIRNQWSVSGLQGSITDPATGAIVTHSILWHGNVTLGLAYAITPNTLFGVRGGGAWGEIKDAANSTLLAQTLGSVPAVASDNVHLGWTGGAFIEHAFAGTPLSIGLEWDYTNLGTHGVTFNGTGAASGTAFNVNDKATFNGVFGYANWKLF